MIDAGPFARWLAEMEEALRARRAADVPCGRCTACCRSSQFVHIALDETDTLAHIAPELLVPTPYAEGHVVMGYDDHGCCPMLTDAGCSIYARRPRTCRTYDCRVFAAAGVESEHPPIAERVAEWSFRFENADDERSAEAVRAAARFVAARTPLGPGLQAVAAVRIHDAFVDGAEPDPPAVMVRIRAAIQPSAG